MKFACIALIASVSAQAITCTDDDAADVCVEEGACCGYLTPAEGDAVRACGDGSKAAAAEYDGEDAFSCDAPAAAEEGASKLALGLSAVVAALYMA
tara:strand:- start:430 stop:717 length:288 start_codon:yes stop_codon:yes gene_type:complete